jgi:hypothetical protein
LFADAELLALTYLRAELPPRPEPYTDGVLLSTKLAPGQSPAKHIRVRRVGGVPYSVVQDLARLDFQVWYDTGSVADEQNRNNLALMVWSLMRALPGRDIQLPNNGPAVTCYRPPGGVEFLGPTSFPDPGNQARTITGLTVEIGTRIRAA